MVHEPMLTVFCRVRFRPLSLHGYLPCLRIQVGSLRNWDNVGWLEAAQDSRHKLDASTYLPAMRITLAVQSQRDPDTRPHPMMHVDADCQATGPFTYAGSQALYNCWLEQHHHDCPQSDHDTIVIHSFFVQVHSSEG